MRRKRKRKGRRKSVLFCMLLGLTVDSQKRTIISKGNNRINTFSDCTGRRLTCSVSVSCMKGASSLVAGGGDDDETW